MKLKTVIENWYHTLPDQKKPIAILMMGVMTLIFFILLLKGLLALFTKPKQPIIPLMIRHSHEIIIPEHSNLRQQLKIHTVQPSQSPHLTSFPGMVEADPARTVNIMPPLTGLLISLHVKLGDHVEQNQILAEINSPDLEQAEANKNKAEAQLRLATAAFKRAQEVYQAGGNSIKEVQITQNDAEQAEVELKRITETLKILEANHHLLTLKAPISGQIIALNAGQGAYITDPTQPIFTLSNLETVWITANIPENFVRYIKKNQAVNITLPAYPKQTLNSTISFINSWIDAETRRNKTRIAIANPQNILQANMFATVQVAIAQPDLIIIPNSAILMNNDTTSVFIETKPWIFERREIQLGFEDDDHVRVLSGLKAGDRIVAYGGVFIND